MKHIKKRTKTIISIITLFIIVGLWNVHKPLPKNISYVSDNVEVSQDNVTFLYDETFLNTDSDERESNQRIFDEIFEMIQGAQEYIVIDMFLFNDFVGKADVYRPLSSELTQEIVAKRMQSPEVPIYFITDPINTFYSGVTSKNIEALEDAGVHVITTNLSQLRDSNMLYSGVWRVALQWFDANSSADWLPNPLESKGEGVGIRSYLASLNFKANHRKVVIVDDSVLVTSANPHDGSSAHSNVALRVDGALYKEALLTEYVVANFSDPASSTFDSMPTPAPISKMTPVAPIQMSDDMNSRFVSVQLLTEEKIRDAMIDSINLLTEGDSLDMAMFYIADRKIIRALKRADERGVQLRLLFDANKDAFGREKNGQPNRQVALELLKKSGGNTTVRWCATHGEQCHSKMLLLRSAVGNEMYVGSANLTKRNIGDYNLETNIRVFDDDKFDAFIEASEFFDRQWSNTPDALYSVEYDEYADTSKFKYWSYRLKEWSGLSRW